MDAFRIVMIVLFVALALITGKVYAAFYPSRQYSPVRMITRIAVFGAMSTILYVIPVFKFSLPFFPSFLEIHIDEIPAFIAGFAYGPWTGIAVIAIKTVMKFVFNGVTATLGVGELTDLVLSSLYVGIATFIYTKKRNLKGVAIGFGVATLVQVLVAMVINVYVMIPFYMNVMNFPVDGLLRMMQVANPAITDVGWSYAFFAVLPFNLVKDAIVIVITFILYRSLHMFLRFEGKKSKTKRLV
ncbi:MAG: ECF transporter S component [Erysipelotrichaceae bacterium]|nr:ECF transporter S component [Erysipelotrichaceae bacterium]